MLSPCSLWRRVPSLIVSTMMVGCAGVRREGVGNSEGVRGGGGGIEGVRGGGGGIEGVRGRAWRESTGVRRDVSVVESSGRRRDRVMAVQGVE